MRHRDGARVWAWIWQAIVLGAVAALIWVLARNTMHNLAARHIATGFGFLAQPASIPVAETPIAYTASVSTYGRAIAIGILNTLKLAAAGVVLATPLGTLIGIGRLARNVIAAKLCALYVEVLRDIPLLLQLFFWYGLLETLPAPHQAWRILPHVFLSDRGLCLPWLEHGQLAYPVLQRFNFSGGITLTPEFLTMLTGLTTYTAAYIAEIVRTGIEAVPRGQWEAASSLGLRHGTTLRRVVLPQALRVIIPPLTSQYLNLTKNSSLAVAIGYQEIVSIADTTLNQTGQAIEGVAIIMAVFLTISLGISLLMNWYNARIALVQP